MPEFDNDLTISKLLNYAKTKKVISFDELTDYLPDNIVNSEKMDEILALLEKNKIKIEEEDYDINFEDDKTPVKRKKVVASEKESTIDDPIRLYLKEIGKENLLTAEEEVFLSKQMEDGENIVKEVIKKSGLFIGEFYRITVKTLSKADFKEMSLGKKEISEYLAEKRRLNQTYREVCKEHLPSLRQYIEMKSKAEKDNTDILHDSIFIKKREEMLKRLSNVELHQNEINILSSKFSNIKRKIKRFLSDQEKIEA